ncbi:hypothetical protein PDJAM_G00193990 [Pangasius djambal]|uniref:Uncharacterized protein n=1 Tax=Pangasius djambal TaxID=1691987 RepID=A0ACC5ZR05_9TELE|nr:hypothetical protein [Pangasius djambal]
MWSFTRSPGFARGSPVSSYLPTTCWIGDSVPGEAVLQIHMAGVKVLLESLRRGLKVDLIREVARQYPFICFVLVSMLSSTIILNR